MHGGKIYLTTSLSRLCHTLVFVIVYASVVYASLGGLQFLCAQTLIPYPPYQLPWLILPQSCPNYLSFFDVYEGNVGKLPLPGAVRGAWFQGCSKSWMIMIKENDLDSTMYLVNPISGVHHQLPPLRTIPSFQGNVETERWKRYGARCVVALSTSDITSDEFMVALTPGGSLLFLCRPGDESWSNFQAFDADESNQDLLFAAGELYALVNSYARHGEVVSDNLRLQCGDHAVVKLKLVYNTIPRRINRINEGFEEYDDYIIYLNQGLRSGLVESTHGEIWLINQVGDLFSKWPDDDNYEDGDGGDYVDGDVDDAGDEDNNIEGDEDEGEEDFDFATIEEDGLDLYLRTSGFNVYKLEAQKDGENDVTVITSVNQLGNQLLFVSDGGALSLPTKEDNKLDGNCIYFATNPIRSLHSRTYTSREIGEFSFDDGKIKRSFPSIGMTIRSQFGWFTPSL